MKRKASVFDNAQMSSLMANIKNRQTVVYITDLDHEVRRVVLLPRDTIAEIKVKVNRDHAILSTVLIKPGADFKLPDMAMVRDCNLVDGDELELLSLECYAIRLKARLTTERATTRMHAYLDAWQFLR